jgi:hypothetical protein
VFEHVEFEGKRYVVGREEFESALDLYYKLRVVARIEYQLQRNYQS